MLNPPKPGALIDARGRPYFLWDCDLTLVEFIERLADSDPEVRAYFLAKLMRQAKPDDVFQFVTLAQIRELWPRTVRHLGSGRGSWTGGTSVPDELTPLQRRILRVLAGLTPPWTLTGGGALAAIHLGHRTTRDLDLFWRSRPGLGHAAIEAPTDLMWRRFARRRCSVSFEFLTETTCVSSIPSPNRFRRSLLRNGRRSTMRRSSSTRDTRSWSRS